MARLACGLEDRPLPAADDPDLVALLPGQEDTAVIATDDDGRPIGAAWWHINEPSLLRDQSGEPLPEMTMAVAEGHRGKGVGRALIDALSAKAAEHFSVLTLNVHLRNPAAHLYTRTGFRVAGAGRGWFGVAMSRPHQAQDDDCEALLAPAFTKRDGSSKQFNSPAATIARGAI
jgi:GNAT superfamily N-acetyltransferase